MRDLSNVNNAPLSSDAQAKEDKEKVKGEIVNKKKLSKAKCKADEPCVFGKHNPEFDKIYLSETKRKAK